MYLFLKMLCFQVGLHSCRCAHVQVTWRSCVAVFMPSCTCAGHVEVMWRSCGDHVWLHSCRRAHVEVMWRSCVAEFVPSCTCGGQRTSCASHFFSSTAWIPRTVRLGGNFSAIFLSSWFYYSKFLTSSLPLVAIRMCTVFDLRCGRDMVRFWNSLNSESSGGERGEQRIFIYAIPMLREGKTGSFHRHFSLLANESLLYRCSVFFPKGMDILSIVLTPCQNEYLSSLH